MAKIDFDEVEDALELVVPDIYRMFIDAVNQKGIELGRHGIYDDTRSIIKGNFDRRSQLAGQKPRWLRKYFDFGIGDGCGNYYFLVATSDKDDVVKLWAHDPPGIENVGTATQFFTEVLAEIEAGFDRPDQCRFQGNNW